MGKSSTNVNFKLQNLRKENNMSYETVAKSVGICKAYYWQIENGNRRLYYDLALRIARVFDKRPDDIFFEYYNK
ncbi:MAG: helix-turn-helix transcriptional regulator [Bacilli bacterium]|jgi:putative transcriptional regulator|nr:helix-turn-helix transcriptional regulator [Bacilli bacterium]MCX4253765.1 helix-turn-helix transcriptional regulator [Bacilli bacterium]